MSTLMIKAFLFMYPLLECNWELYRVWGQMLPHFGCWEQKNGKTNNMAS